MISLEPMVSACFQLGYKEAFRSLEKVVIVYALQASRGNKTQAAKMLGMNRSTLTMKIKALKINLEMN